MFSIADSRAPVNRKQKDPQTFFQKIQILQNVDFQHFNTLARFLQFRDFGRKQAKISLNHNFNARYIEQNLSVSLPFLCLISINGTL